MQRSLGWATTKKSIAMTGQRRKNSMQISVDSTSRKNSANSRNDSIVEHLEQQVNVVVNNEDFVEDLLNYSARRYSIFLPTRAPKNERSILDDAEFFMSKKECDYGTCQCCPTEKKAQTNWESIEEIIENDPEIIFDCDDNPIVVEPVKKFDYLLLDSGSNIMSSGISLTKRIQLERLPDIFKTICNKLSHTSLT